MCKANDVIVGKVEELMEIRKMITELEQEADAITDEIKEYMGFEEDMVVGVWRISYKETVSHRLDTKELKKDLGDALESYYRTVITRPFKVN